MEKQILFRRLFLLLNLLTGFYFSVQTVSAQAPMTYSTPQGGLDTESVYPVFSNVSGYGTASGTWSGYPASNASASSYTITGNFACRKISIRAVGEGDDPAAIFTLSGSDYKKDVSSYDRISVDVWTNAQLSNGEIYFGLVSPSSNAGYKLLRKSIVVSNDDVGKWVTIDFNVSELTCYWETFDKNLILEALQEVRFLADSKSSFTKEFYVDNIYFYKVDGPEPEVVAAPEHDNLETNVLPVYSSQYGRLNLSYEDWGASVTTVADEEGNSVLKAANLNFVPRFPSDINVSQYHYLNVDVYPLESGLSSFKLSWFLWGAGLGDVDLEFTLDSELEAEKWNTISIPLSSFTSGKLKQITAMRLLSNQSSSSLYLDNIFFYKVPADLTGPAYPAYLPPALSSIWGAKNVVSIFSDSYTNENTALTFAPDKVDFVIYNNAISNAWRFDDTNNVSISIGSPVAISDMEKFHIDVYTKSSATFQIKLNDNAAYVYPSASENYNTTANSWKQIEIDLPGGLTSLNKIEIIGSSEMDAYFVDNIYFYKEPEETTPSPIEDVNKELGRGINFGGFFEDNVSTWNPNYINLLADMGFAHIRLPMNLEINDRSIEEAPYNIDENFIKEIHEIIDSSLVKGMKIIIDFHHHDTLKAHPREQWNRFLTQWEQVANYFRYYPEDLIFELLNEPTDSITSDIWNELLVDGLEVVRASNPTRPVIIGTTDWGSTEGVKSIVLPATDQRLILTVHYYNPFNFTHQGQEWMGDDMLPTGVEWLDTKEERDAMDADFSIVDEYVEDDPRPIYYGEFGTFDKGDIDSRVRWITYLSRYYEEREWSYALWSFTDLYDIAERKIIQPIFEALFKNPMPEKPFGLTTTAVETLYDSNRDGCAGWGSYGYKKFSNDNNKIEITIADGQKNAWDVQASIKGFTFEKGSTYRVSFVASSSHSDYTYISNLASASNSTYTSVSFTPGTEKQPFSFVCAIVDETSENDRLAFDLGGVTGTTEVMLYFEDIVIEKVEQRLPAVLNNNPAKSTIYSSISSSNPTITFSDMENANYVANTRDNNVIAFTNFPGQTIQLENEITTGENSCLYMYALAGSPFELTVKINDQEEIFSLPSHEWTSLKMDLPDNATVSNIEFSGGTGMGRKLYLDHIYLYQKNQDDVVYVSGGGETTDGNYTSLSDALNKLGEMDMSGQAITLTVLKDLTETEILDVSGNWEKLILTSDSELETPPAILLSDVNVDNSNIIVQADVVIENDLSIINSGCLEIAAGSVVLVNGKTTNSNPDGLIIKSRELTYEDGAAIPYNATFIFSNGIGDVEAGDIAATVEMFSLAENATTEWISPGGNTYEYRWQYFTAPVEGQSASFSGSTIYKYNPAGDNNLNGGQGGSPYWMIPSGSFDPFTGYCIHRPSNYVYQWKGNLVNSDFEMNLEHLKSPITEEQIANKWSDFQRADGKYLLGNPYTAAVDITQMVFEEGLEATIYIYNTGSTAEWYSSGDDATGRIVNGSYLNTAPGTTMTIPQEYAGKEVTVSPDGTVTFPKYIPSMQAFTVVSKEDSNENNNKLSFSYNHEDGKVAKNDMMLRDVRKLDMSYLLIELKQKGYSDKILLATHPDCKKGFDNGWDGRTTPNSTQPLSVFTIEEEEGVTQENSYYQISTMDNFEDVYLGILVGNMRSVKEGESDELVEYKLVFNHAITDGSLFLKDLYLNKTVDISESGTSYAFVEANSGEIQKRFRITTDSGIITGIEEQKTVESYKIYSNNKSILVENPGEAGSVMICDITGRSVLASYMEANAQTRLDADLQPGIYLVRIIVAGRSVTKTIVLK